MGLEFKPGGNGPTTCTWYTECLTVWTLKPTVGVQD